MSQTDTRFSAAVHLLVLLALAEEPPSSALMAESVGINPSQVRRLLGLLKGAGIVASRQGVEGYALARAPEDVTLLAVYEAVHGRQGMHVMALHRNPSDECLAGRHIAAVLGNMFGELDARLATELAARTLEDVASAMRAAVAKDAKKTT